MTPSQILRILRKEFKSVSVYGRVYNQSAEAPSKTFIKNSDPSESMWSYLCNTPTLKLLCEQNNPTGISFTANFAPTILTRYNVCEVLINSIFKTSRQKLKLFVVMALGMRDRFPVTYFMLKGATRGSLKSRKVKNAYPGQLDSTAATVSIKVFLQ